MKLTHARIEEVRALRWKSLPKYIRTRREVKADRESHRAAAFRKSEEEYESFAVELARKHKVPLRADAGNGIL